MQDTVDQVYGAVPRALANVVEDARRAAGRLGRLDRKVRWARIQAREKGTTARRWGPSGGCRVLGRGLQEATVAGMLGVRPGQVSGYRGHSGEFGRPMLTLSDRLDQLVPAEDCEAAVAFRTAGEI